ncbi:MAG: hypothetical protein H6834_00035 [Planctomycetes bacterium]|nr:hypothetical protein [Planctomycetota bacterium]
MLNASATGSAPLSIDSSPLPLDAQDEAALSKLLDAAGFNEIEPAALDIPASMGFDAPYDPLGASWWALRTIVDYALREVFYYLHNREHGGVAIRDRIREMFEDAIQPGDVVVAHSMGSIIAYDCLSRDLPKAPKAAALVTLGSPLGLNLLRDWLPRDPKRHLVMPPRVMGQWSNAFDPRDIFVRLEGVEWGGKLGLLGDLASTGGRFREYGDLKIEGFGHHAALEYLEKFGDQILPPA